MFGRKKNDDKGVIVGTASRIAGPKLLRVRITTVEGNRLQIGGEIVAYRPTQVVIRSIRNNQAIGTYKKVIGNGQIVKKQDNEVIIKMTSPLIRCAYCWAGKKKHIVVRTEKINKVDKQRDFLSLGKIALRQINEFDHEDNFKKMCQQE